MRKLERGAAPACLASYRHGRDNWSQVTPQEKAMIWTALEQMQGLRCAYCEGPAIDGKRHIEHFRQKGRDPTITFAWANLFGSCNRNASCGRYKDELPAYNPADLIKPDVEDPEHFFLFVTDGSIAIREGLSAADKRRAAETIRIFNLNYGLRQLRYSAIVNYIAQGDEARRMVEAGECTREECLELLQAELAATADLPFATAIRHTLLPA